MKNIYNMNIFNTSLEEAIKTSLFYKDKYGRLRKKTNDYSGLQAAFANEPVSYTHLTLPTNLSV